MKVKHNRKKGQNTAEYLLMLTLVVIGSITLLTAFGKTIQNKMAYVSSALSGDEATYLTSQTNVTAAAKKAVEKAKTAGNIKTQGIDKEELKDSGI